MIIIVIIVVIVMIKSIIIVIPIMMNAIIAITVTNDFFNWATDKMCLHAYDYYGT